MVCPALFTRLRADSAERDSRVADRYAISLGCATGCPRSDFTISPYAD